MARKIQELDQRRQQLGITEDEEAFYVLLSEIMEQAEARHKEWSFEVA